MKKNKKIIIKFGTSTLTQGTKKLSRRFMLSLVQQIVAIHEYGHDVVVVSSGAMAAGREVLQEYSLERSLPSKQMFAAIGQVQLMQLWTELFSLFGVNVGQILLTGEDFSHRRRYLNARDTLSCLLHHRVIPIINENDTVATKEIRVGDNDNLAALVANLVGADLLILLTDQKGLYTADPRHDPEAQLIPVVKHIDETIFKLAGGTASGLGTGGMRTKIEAAQIAARCGTSTIIASSQEPDILRHILDGKSAGTLFQSEISPRESRKRWLLAEKKQGDIFVDEGAAQKISHEGASLLPSGITHTAKNFERGAFVHIRDPEGKMIAVGISNYGTDEIEKLIGLHSGRIEDVLGYSYGHEVIHRTNMTRIKDQTETSHG